jgi:O-antigen/teichoic acid export membrane protein
MNRQQLSAHLATPLYRNGYALVANTAVTAAVGAVYWIIAARRYSAGDVGINAAMISSMVFLAKVAQVNMANALNRFVPSAHSATPRLIRGAYLAAVCFAALAGSVFVIGIPWWTPDLQIIRSSTAMAVWFVAAVMVWAVFVLQDAALTGLRRATWVLAENSIYGAAKLGLLVSLAVVAPGLGIFLSWTLPLVLLILPINVLIFGRAVPDHVATTGEDRSEVDGKGFARFAVADFFASFGWVGTVNLLPVIVLALEGPEANAHFFLAWTIAVTLFSIGRNTGMSLVTEGAHEPQRLWSYGRKVFVQTTWLVVPISVVLIVFAPQVLGVFGTEYSRESSATLRLLAAAALPQTVIFLYASVVRVQRRMRALTILHLTHGVAMLALSVFLVDLVGIEGVGWAGLVTAVVIAAVLLVAEMRPLWLPALGERRMLRRPLAWLGRLRRRAATGPFTRRAEIRAAFADLAQLPEIDMGRMRVIRHVQTDLKQSVVMVGDGPEPDAMVKVARTDVVSTSLSLEADALRSLHVEPRLEGWADRYVPNLLGSGRIHGRAYVVQNWVRGVNGQAALADWEADSLVAEAVRVIGRLHEQTASATVVDHQVVDRLLAPVEDAFSLDSSWQLPQQADVVERLLEQARRELEGRVITTGWTHGDYWLGNLLFAGPNEVAAVVDWSEMNRGGYPGMDIVHLLLSTRALRSGRELGSVINDALAHPQWSETEAEAIAHLDEMPWHTLVFLTWLQHVASNIRRADRTSSSWLWIANNVDQVLSKL